LRGLPEPAVSRSALNILCWAGLAVFTAYLLRVNDLYYRANTQTPTYDEAWYLETSLHLYHRLTREGLAEFADAYRRAFGTKAPLLSVLPLPFYLIFGASHYSALLVNSFFIVVSNLYLFLFVRRLFSPDVGLAAVVFYQTMPLAFGLSRAFMAEYGLAALVIVWLYYLEASGGFTRGSANFMLGVVLGFGLLMKVLFPAFIAGPLLLVWLRRQRTRQARSAPPAETFWLWRACARWPPAAILAPSVVIAGSWYAFNLPAVLRFAWESAYGGVGKEYHAGGFTRWLLMFLNEGAGFYYAAALALLGSLCLAIYKPRRPAGGSAAWLLLSWLGPPFAAMAAGRNHLIRFVLPLLPVFAIALAVSIFHLGSRWILQAALALALAVFPQRLYAKLSYFRHDAGHEHAVRWGPFVLSGSELGWAHPPVWQSPWEHRRLLEALRRLAGDADRPEYVIVGVEHVYLNANLLSYLNAYDEYPLRFTSLGYAESSPGRAVERIYSLDARFLIFGEGFEDLPEFLNRVNSEVQARAARGELPYHLQAEVPLAHRMKALIYERDASWTSFLPGSQAPAPEHPAAAGFDGGVRFLGYDWTRRDGYLWQLSLYWTTAAPVRQEYRVNLEFLRAGKTVLVRNHYVAEGRRPFRAWAPGEVVRETFPVYAPPGGGGRLEVRLSLTPWGAGPEGSAVRLGLAE
jgi:4-amino-4-deoxy-L-arabinose transferase-like glycosyltransferase